MDRLAIVSIASVIIAAPLLTGCTPTPTPEPTATPSVTATEPVPAPTKSVSPSPSPEAAAPTVPTEDVLARCEELTAAYFAGNGTDALTYHFDRAQVGTRPDGTFGVYIPVTDTTPRLVVSEFAATCILSADLASAEAHAASDRWTDEKIAQLMNGTEPEMYSGDE